jgi:predicted ATPase
MKLTSIRIKQFKAVDDSGTLKLGPLTAFVGFNGTGKSSIIEACEFLQNYALGGLEAALSPWFGFEHILWQGAERKRQASSPFYTQPLVVEVAGKVAKTPWRATLEIGELAEPAGKFAARTVLPKREHLKVGKLEAEYHFESRERGRPRTGSQILDDNREVDFRKWLFLSLNPHDIGQPRRRPEGRSEEPLMKTGANLAEILKSFLDTDPDGFDGLIQSLQYIVPYAANLRPDVVRDLVETRSLIQLTERFGTGRDVPLSGWVLSGGTLRILALLAALRHPAGPSVLFIEELENGLDPRAIGFVIDEIRYATLYDDKQVILTTHSPYLLDKLALKHVVMVDRPPGAPPVFRRPAADDELSKWSKSFAPGSLYSMGMLRSKERRNR